MPENFLIVPDADCDVDGLPTTLANAILDTDVNLAGLTNGTAYRALLLANPSDTFTPAAASASVMVKGYADSGGDVNSTTRTVLVPVTEDGDNIYLIGQHRGSTTITWPSGFTDIPHTGDQAIKLAKWDGVPPRPSNENKTATWGASDSCILHCIVTNASDIAIISQSTANVSQSPAANTTQNGSLVLYNGYYRRTGSLSFNWTLGGVTMDPQPDTTVFAAPDDEFFDDSYCNTDHRSFLQVLPQETAGAIPRVDISASGITYAYWLILELLP